MSLLSNFNRVFLGAYLKCRVWLFGPTIGLKVTEMSGIKISLLLDSYDYFRDICQYYLG